MKFAVFALSVAFLVGCAVTPRFVEPAAPSLDNGADNSGVITNAGSGYVVTELWAERYTNLVKNFGNRCNPPMVEPRWITPTTNHNYVVSSDAMRNFMLMNVLSLQHQKP